MLREYASEILSFLAGLAGGGSAGSLITLRLTKKTSASGHGSISDQSGARAGGDVIGRDKITK
jgi:hypothetical protein